MRHHLIAATLAAPAALAALAAPAAANIFTNGSFETGDTSGFTLPTNATFNVPGVVDCAGQSGPASDGACQLAFTGPGNALLFQDLATTVGAAYLFAFDYAGPAAGATFPVVVNGRTEFIDDLSGAQWRTYQRGFVAARATTRIALSVNNLAAGATLRLDNFRLIETPGAGAAPVPEPAAWALMIAGFGLVGAAARRARPARTPAAGDAGAPR